MSCFWSIATIILLQCVIKVLSEPHKEHQKNNALHDERHTGHKMHLRHKTHGRHSASKHTAAASAQRETVPSPVQDFVLVSGSPLFHERSRASDSKANATIAQEAKDQKVPQMAQGNKTAANQTLAQGQQTLASKQEPTQQQKQESSGLTDNSGTAKANGNSTQGPSESSKPSPAFVQELAKKIKESLNKGKDEGKKENGTQSITPAVSLTLQTPGKTNASNGVVVGLENKPVTNAEQGKPVGKNASVPVITISPSGQNTESLSPDSDGKKGNKTTTTTVSDVKPEAQVKKPSNGNFPFNVPGVRNAGNGTVDNIGVDSTNQIEKDKKLGLHESLGPNCHWKTTKGANGALITSVQCSGEFHRPEANKGGSDEVAKNPQPGDASKVGLKESSSQQHTAVNTSVSETSKSNKEIQMQSDEEFEMEALGTTNAFRKIHRALPIKLDPKLNLEARKYAERIAGMGSLQHDYDAVRQSDEGENLAMGCKEYGVPLTAKEAITNWYNEVCSYDFDRGEFSMSSGHFTQVVWADSHEFGIGKAAGYQNGMPCVFVVGRFKPSGNYNGEYKKNVFKGTFDSSYCDKLRDKKLL
ncbi:uncharacterized protein LOC111330941 [Stylophora pistillata]|uniref:Golgi-associated plant pathogenesis-related protein 1 n=1 Tax=Stylophora pistillata TaxID=50429 RepID=A0A2B4S8M9_STYPI|nr:uncharacterized protein LOC111330941 [Stylophora pistillata]PFX24938.1 Golgi-associated plant pathogenesis-related protein 1 [Stylophora pistillata]